MLIFGCDKAFSVFRYIIISKHSIIYKATQSQHNPFQPRSLNSFDFLNKQTCLLLSSLFDVGPVINQTHPASKTGAESWHKSWHVMLTNTGISCAVPVAPLQTRCDGPGESAEGYCLDWRTLLVERLDRLWSK